MIQGILLAAGASTRFGGRKLLHPLRDGTPLGLASARALRQAVDDVVVIVRPGELALFELFARDRFDVRICPAADQGMGASLAYGVRETGAASAWLVALADMPFVRAETIAAVAGLLAAGAAIAAPVYQGRRGHPVGFSRHFARRLGRLRGGAGARRLLDEHPDQLWTCACDDPGVLVDIDTPSDLATC